MKSTIYATAARRSTAITFALVVAFGSLFTPLAAQAATPVSSITQASPASAASWVPYDNSAITSEGNCEARRTWLIANVNWITQTNSDCWSFYQPGCPTGREYWMVMVNSASGRVASEVTVSKDPLAAAC